MKPIIVVAKVNYELMVDINILLNLVATVPVPEVVKALVVYSQFLYEKICDFTRTLHYAYKVEMIYIAPKMNSNLMHSRASRGYVSSHMRAYT